ncbi:DJ-1/PfpI family protein [Eikenella sp. S3360]|uniref:DJ-1/PfpI family protein n=1 Tax=Eikenella glucosivorans TaxID=2766967 RepID=A0ABS0NAL9_9NEIS|nr:DJ-1/PfpI family protein [Eikenella glucosivorans]MBH5329347.1 DJ-1/PfpI family protein [Eikenella glucosivorans]
MPSAFNPQAATDIYCLLFDQYETLDLMGPVEFLFRLPQSRLHYVSRGGGMVASRQGFAVQTQRLERLPENSLLLVPGGQGTRPLVRDAAFLRDLGAWLDQAACCLSVCTGAALLAASGRLDGLPATSNKKAFDWVCSVGGQAGWQPAARWVAAGRFYTSSGVSAGMDMTLGFIADHYGRSRAEEIAAHCEYIWHDNPADDPFAPSVFR